jgi:hypothetical protein
MEREKQVPFRHDSQKSCDSGVYALQGAAVDVDGGAFRGQMKNNVAGVILRKTKLL